MSGDQESWVQTQKKTFTKWTNNHLRKKGYPLLEDAETAWEDGIKLMQLINALYGLPLPKFNANPKMRPHKLDNINLGLKMVEDARIKTNFLKNVHLIDHDLKMILGMMWAIILDYSIKGISEDDLTAKEGLLLWCRKKTAGYRDVDPPSITNFTHNWKNGMAFLALIHRHRPDLVDYDSLNKDNAAENLENAFRIAEGLGIPRLLDVEDCLQPVPDERSIMTQVSEYYLYFSTSDAKETAARRAAKFLAFTRSLNNRKSEYESAVRTLLDWVNHTIARFQSTDYGSTVDEAIAVNDGLRAFLLTEKPEKTANKLDLESQYAEIQTTLRVNNRPAYVPPADVSPEAVDAAFDALWAAEKAHAQEARARRFAFVSKTEESLSEEKIQEFKDSFAHFDADKDNAMSRIELKAALSAMSIPCKDDSSLDRLFAEISQGGGAISLEQWIRWNTELFTDKDTPEQIKASFRALADERNSIDAAGLRVPPLSQEDFEYLSSVMPQHAEGGYDYAAFVDASFAQ